MTKNENYRPVSLTDTNGKTLNNVLGNQIQQFIKRVLYTTTKSYTIIPIMQRWLDIQKSMLKKKINPPHQQAKVEKQHDHINGYRKGI